MSDVDATVAQAREVFDGLGPIAHRKMFGGAGLWCDGVIFAIVTSDSTICLKARGAFAEELAAQGAEQFSPPMKGRAGTTMPYWSLPDEALDNPELALALARKALDGARAEAG